MRKFENVTRRLSYEQLELRELFTTALFFNPNSSYISTSNADTFRLLFDINHVPYTKFTDISAAGLRASLANMEQAIIPAPQKQTLSDDLTAEARGVFRDYVTNGGTLLVSGDSYGLAPGQAAASDTFINSIFGTAIDSINVKYEVDQSTPNKSPFAQTDVAGDSVFSSAALTLPFQRGNVVKLDSLPAGATVYYDKDYNLAANPSVPVSATNFYSFPVGSGKVVFLSGFSDTIREAKYRDIILRLVKPQVVTVTSVAPDPRTTVVSQLDVTFAIPIDPATFTNADLRLTRGDGGNLIGPGVSITTTDNVHFQVQGLNSLTSNDGTYQFSVIPGGINDSGGLPLKGTSSDTRWQMEAALPFVSKVIDVSPKIRNDADGAVKTVDVIFSEPIQSNSFTTADLKLFRNGGANLITSATTITPISSTRYRIGNLRDVTATRGSYELAVDGVFTDLAGNSASSSQSITWIQNQGPYIGTVSPRSFQIGGPAILIAPGASVFDPESATLKGGQLSVSIATNVFGQDNLGIRNQGTGAGQISVSGANVLYEGVVIGTKSGGTGGTKLTITFNNQATVTKVQALVRNLSFQNTEPTPANRSRTLLLQLTDGMGGTGNVRSQQINFA